MISHIHPDKIDTRIIEPSHNLTALGFIAVGNGNPLKIGELNKGEYRLASDATGAAQTKDFHTHSLARDCPITAV